MAHERARPRKSGDPARLQRWGPGLERKLRPIAGDPARQMAISIERRSKDSGALGPCLFLTLRKPPPPPPIQIEGQPKHGPVLNLKESLPTENKSRFARQGPTTIFSAPRSTTRLTSKRFPARFVSRGILGHGSNAEASWTLDHAQNA